MRRPFRSIGATRCERLEPRTLLAFAPLGPAFPVNPVGAGDQTFPAVASDADGDFVVAWTSENPGAQVMARRYNAQGIPLGSDFRVDTTGGATRREVAIAADADGDFAVAWVAFTPDLGQGIYVQRFTAAGIQRGGEFRVNTAVGNHLFPSVALDADGDMVVAWSHYPGPGIGGEIRAQRFDADGIRRGAEIVVVASAANEHHTNPSVATDADGDFIVTWEGWRPNPDIYAQRYNAAGVPQGGRFPVAVAAGTKEAPSVSADADGDFVIAWTRRSSISNYDVYLRRFNPQGVAQTDEVLANAAGNFERFAPAIALDADGDFTATWNSYHQDGSVAGVYARHFSAAAAPLGNEFLVPAVTAGAQAGQMIATDADGDTVIAWHSYGQDGDRHGIYAQRYDETTDTAGPVVTDVVVAGDRVNANERLVSVVPQITVYFSENLSTLGGATGANSPTNPANWVLTRNGVAVPAVQSVTFGFNAATNKYEAVLTLSPAQAEGSYVLTAKGNLRDVGGNTLDGNFDGAPGGDFSRAFEIALPVNVGPEFRVNTVTALSQEKPSVAVTPAGDFIVAWTSTGQAGVGYGIYAQRYNAGGVAQGGQITVTNVPSNYSHVAVAADAAGNFVVAWHQNSGGGGGGVSLQAQRYNAAGAPLGNLIFIDFTTDRPLSLAVDADGDFVIAWTRPGAQGDLNVVARRYNAQGVAQGTEFPVNVVTTHYQFDPSVAMDADGDFVVAWISMEQDGSGYGVYARRYNADGNALGTEFPVNVFTTGNQFEPSVASDDDGDFVVAWTSKDQDGSGYGVYARRYSAAGVARGTEFRVNTATAGNQFNPSVASDADGDFVVAWQSFAQDGSAFGVYAQRYSADGVAQSAELPVNTFTTDNQFDASAASDADGDFVIAWTSVYQDGSVHGVYAQRYAANERPTTLGLPSVTVAEDEADTLIDLRPFFADSTDAPAGLALSILSNSNPGLFSAASINAATGVLTLDYAPDANGEAQLTIRATDSGGLSVDSTFTVTVNAVNDAPVNHVPDPQFPRRGEPVVFSTANGNAITVTDADAGGARVVVTLQFPRGTRVSLAPAGGISIIEESGELLRFRGRLEDVNAALNGMTVTTEEERADETTLTITTDDGGATGAGGPMSDTDVISIVYNPEPPLLNVSDVTVIEGNAGTTAAMFTVSFKGEPLAGQVVRVRYDTADGTATAAGGDYVPVSGLLEFTRGETEKTVTVVVNGELSPEQDETFFLNLSAPQYAIPNDPQGVATINDDDTPPRVSAVFFNGTRWTTAFRGALAAAGLGDAALGFALPAGQQLTPVPWDGIDQVSIRFDRDVVLLQNDLDIRGATVAHYPTSRMTYNATTRTATWTLPAAVHNDKLLLDLNGDPGGVHNSAGLRLDGEGSGAAFPSGDGSPGGDFKYRFNVLTGDANRDGRVNAIDVLDVRRRLRRSTTNPGSGASGYDLFRDPSGDGSIGIADEAIVRRYLGQALPTGEPTPSAPAPATSARRIAPITRGFFGERPIVS